MKRAIFLVVQDGEIHSPGDKPDLEKIVYASTNEEERDAWFKTKDPQNRFTCKDQVFDLGTIAAQTLQQLDALQKLSLESSFGLK